MRFTEKEKAEIAKAWKRLKWIAAFLFVAFLVALHAFAGRNRIT